MSPDYEKAYRRALAGFIGRPVFLLEVGVFAGGGLRWWREFLGEPATLVGIDIRRCDPPPGAWFVKGDQTSRGDLVTATKEHASGGWDLVVDDASHFAAASRATFSYLFRDHVRPGGVYIIEDWYTGYWPSWPDGERPLHERPTLDEDYYLREGAGHAAGMVGFVKSLIDECDEPTTSRTVDRIEVSYGLTFVWKKEEGQ